LGCPLTVPLTASASITKYPVDKGNLRIRESLH
jgi:hypothetical protein